MHLMLWRSNYFRCARIEGNQSKPGQIQVKSGADSDIQINFANVSMKLFASL
jgi:hypothetical protein